MVVHFTVSLCFVDFEDLLFEDITHQAVIIAVAADLQSQNNGCENYQTCPAKHSGKCACTNCKYADHAGTIIIALDV